MIKIARRIWDRGINITIISALLLATAACTGSSSSPSPSPSPSASASASPQPSQPVVDQAQIPSSNSGSCCFASTGSGVAQSFTVGFAGALTGADLEFRQASCVTVSGQLQCAWTTPDITVQVWGTAGGAPSANLGSSGTISSGSVRMNSCPTTVIGAGATSDASCLVGDLIHVDFSPRINVTAGEVLALVLQMEVSSTVHVFQDFGFSYGGGNVWVPAQPLGSGWVPGSGRYSMFFRTYVARSQ